MDLFEIRALLKVKHNININHDYKFNARTFRALIQGRT